MAEEIHTQFSLCLFIFNRNLMLLLVGQLQKASYHKLNSICDIYESDIAVTNVALQIGFIRLIVVGF
jgi:hypothetical protein